MFLLMIMLIAKAQTTALDFTTDDCNGIYHNLFATLDSNNVVIIEFFMLSCGSCITAGDKLDEMHDQMDIEFPGQVRFYHFGFDDAYSCTDISNWVTANGYNSVPFDSGAYQVAYYGGMAMPTVVVVAGATHEVLFLNNTGFGANDTNTIANAIRNFYGVLPGVGEYSSTSPVLQLSPNPARDALRVQFASAKPNDFQIQIIDSQGRLQSIVEGREINEMINISTLANGVYFLTIKSDGIMEQHKFTVLR